MRNGVLGALLTTVFAFAAVTGISDAQAQGKLRLLTWSGYAPDEVVAQFEQETGIDVEVTFSNNEEMISKLRATRGAGFDLAQPSQDRIEGPQVEFGIYKPMDLSQIDSSLFIGSLLESTQQNTTVDGEVYGVPHVWGTSGLVVDRSVASDVKDYADLCSGKHAGEVSMRLKRPVLIGFAFSMGMDPFAAYGNVDEYREILDKVAEALVACKSDVKLYWEGTDQLLAAMSTGEVKAAMAWDTGGWQLNNENPDVTFVAPSSGALGWVDTFVLPARGENDEAAYKWINFVMQPDIAAKITADSGQFTASAGGDQFVSDKLKAQFADSFPPEAIDNINWYPTVPAGLEDIEGRILDRIRAAN
ncbi:MAG: extracellular solute-binding protein [Alphaproteobacteria bacterium]